jgi:hypothetical protein
MLSDSDMFYGHPKFFPSCAATDGGTPVQLAKHVD